MDDTIYKLRKLRQFLLQQVDGLSTEALNKIPAGFNNNIVWNLGHLICAQQSLCYLRAGQPVRVDEKYIRDYITGTVPAAFVSGPETEEMKALFLSSVDRLEEDLAKGIFTSYTPSPNVMRIYGIELRTIGDALEFLLYHEGFHAGVIAALRKLVG